MPVRAYKDAKGRTRYAVEFQQAGARVHRRLHPTATRSDALELETHLRSEVFSGDLGKLPDLTIEEAILQWLEDTLSNKKDQTKPVQNAKLLAPHIAGRMLSEIGTVATEAARTWASRGLTPATINRRLCVLKASAKHAWVMGRCEENLSSRVRLMREENKRETYLTPEEVRTLAGCAPSAPVTSAIMLAAYTGLRASELLALTQSSLQDSSLTVAKSKTGKPRRVPVTRVLRPWLSALPLGISYWQLHKGFCEARKAAGMPHVRFHDLRHTTASMLINAGVPLEVVGEILGHANLATTQRYAHLSQGTLRKAMQKLV